MKNLVWLGDFFKKNNNNNNNLGFAPESKAIRTCNSESWLSIDPKP